MTHDEGGHMKDERLDDLLREAKESYRVPPTAPFDAMWERIEHDHFDVPRALEPLDDTVVAAEGVAPLVLSRDRQSTRRRSWLAPAAGIAATLLVGIGIGRVSAPTAVRAVAELPAVEAVGAAADRPRGTGSNVADPLQRATYEYIARAVALLDSIPAAGAGATLRGDARFVADASQLLGTTRLLLDSPAASDPRMRDLLEDLELVLAQVARLRTAPRADELTFIAEAMDSRDVVPRLRTVVASYSAAGY